MRVPAAIAAIGLDGRLLRCNPAYCEIVGGEMEELVGADAAAFVHPDDLERAVSASVVRMESNRRSGTTPDPIRMLRRDGTTVWVQFDSMLVDDGSTEPYALATMADVTRQVESEVARAGSRRRDFGARSRRRRSVSGSRISMAG